MIECQANPCPLPSAREWEKGRTGFPRILAERGRGSGPRRSRRKNLAILLGGSLVVWLVAAYLVAPALWERYAHRHPAFEDLPGVTYTADGIPADPINVALIGTKAK